MQRVVSSTGLPPTPLPSVGQEPPFAFRHIRPPISELHLSQFLPILLNNPFPLIHREFRTNHPQLLINPFPLIHQLNRCKPFRPPLTKNLGMPNFNPNNLSKYKIKRHQRRNQSFGFGFLLVWLSLSSLSSSFSSFEKRRGMVKRRKRQRWKMTTQMSRPMIESNHHLKRKTPRERIRCRH